MATFPTIPPSLYTGLKQRTVGQDEPRGLSDLMTLAGNRNIPGVPPPPQPAGLEKPQLFLAPTAGSMGIPGMIERGNVDLSMQPIVQNPDGTSSTVDSVSFNSGGQEILVPKVHSDGYIMTDEQAWQQYLNTGRHLGKFKDSKLATNYATILHNDYESGKIGLRR